jgi:hypothetical protein
VTERACLAASGGQATLPGGVEAGTLHEPGDQTWWLVLLAALAAVAVATVVVIQLLPNPGDGPAVVGATQVTLRDNRFTRRSSRSPRARPSPGRSTTAAPPTTSRARAGAPATRRRGPSNTPLPRPAATATPARCTWACTAGSTSGRRPRHDTSPTRVGPPTSGSPPLEQQADLARLAWLPAVPPAGPKLSREEDADRTAAQVGDVCRTNPDGQPTWTQAMNQVPTPRREARTPPRRQLRVTRWQHRLSTAGSCATGLARRYRTDSLGRVEVTDRDDMPLGLHDPRAEARRTEAVLDPSAVGVVHEAAGQRDAVSRAVAPDKPGDVGGHPRDNGRRGGDRGRRRP